MRLSCVLDNDKTFAQCEFAYRLHVDEPAVEMYRDNRFAAPCECRTDLVGVDRQRQRIAIYEHWPCATILNRSGRRYESHGCRNHLVALGNAGC